MSRISLTVLPILFLTFLLVACNTTNSVREQELQKDEYLKKNFPAKKQGNNTNTPVETTFDK